MLPLEYEAGGHDNTEYFLTDVITIENKAGHKLCPRLDGKVKSLTLGNNAVLAKLIK